MGTLTNRRWPRWTWSLAVGGLLALAAVPAVLVWSAPQPAPGEDPRDFSWQDVDLTDVDSDAWVEIPGGTFEMGAELGAPTWTEPVHSVTVPTFRISRFPITNEQYVAYLRENPDAPVPPQLARTDYSGGRPKALRDSIREGWDRHPVTNVTWNEAMAFVRWLDARVEGHVDLPSEAQWEFAARGVEGRSYPWGEGRPSPRRAAFGSRSGPMPRILRFGPTSGPGWAGFRVPVDTYRDGATPEGVYDLAGNIAEWVADCVHRGGYEGAPDDGSEWGGGLCDRETTDVRILRGGSWRDNAPLLHAARRFRAPAEERRGWYGFRVVWKPEGERQPPSPQGAPQRLYYPRQLDATAPDTFTAHFETDVGSFAVRVHRAWAPNSADRFYNLVTSGFYDGNRIYRVIEGALAQWGIHDNEWVDHHWFFADIEPDPVRQSNTGGRVALARALYGGRTTEVFVNYRDNPALDAEGFAPFGEVVRGMEVAERFHSGYGDGPERPYRPLPERRTGPDQNRFGREGGAYADERYPELTRIVRAWVEGGG